MSPSILAPRNLSYNNIAILESFDQFGYPLELLYNNSTLVNPAAESCAPPYSLGVQTVAVGQILIAMLRHCANA